MTRSDRKTLVLLLILLGSFVGYVALTQPRTLRKMRDPRSQDTLARMRADSLQSLADSTDSVIGNAESKGSGWVTTERYPGPPKRESYLPKLKPGETMDLNRADTTLLRRIPGVGPSYARRIAKYRDLLGGYYCVEQLQEVYGMTRGKYDSIAPYVIVRSLPKKIVLRVDSITRHPYLSYAQRDAFMKILRRDSVVTWKSMMESGTFRRDDSLRLAPYLPL